MFGLSPKFIKAIFIVIGIGCLYGIMIGGLLGLAFLSPMESPMYAIAAFLIYAPTGGIIGSFIGGLTVLYVTYCAAMNANESANEGE